MATAVIDLKETTKGVDKITKYGWTLQDQPGTFKYLDKRHLIINDEYQRNATPGKVRDLAKNWSWIACGAVTVALRDGAYWVVDGQHRVLAAKKRSDITTLPCLVFATSDIAEEAQGFLNANANRKPVSAVAKHHAAVVAGDALAGRLQQVFDSSGVTLVDRNSNSPTDFRAVALARRLASDRFDLFSQVFKVTVSLAGSAGTMAHERLLAGLYYIARNVDGGFDQPRLQKRLEAVGARELLEAANRAAAFFARGGDKVFAAGMIEALNKGLQKRFSLKA